MLADDENATRDSDKIDPTASTGEVTSQAESESVTGAEPAAKPDSAEKSGSQSAAQTEPESPAAPEPGSETSPESETASENTVSDSTASEAAAESASEAVPASESVPTTDGENATADGENAASATTAVADAPDESAQTSAESKAQSDAEPAQESDAASAPVTAVSLGLLPETFVSRVSTALHFYAPEVIALPARPADEPESSESGSAGGSSSRRRGRRRGGNGDERQDEGGESGKGRQRAVEVITEPQRVKGSTRLEAKRQRRRDGREAGRRRPVVTEAEFLARREAVDRVMVVRSKNGRIQIGVLEDNVLVEHYVARNQESSLIGNVYLGRVQNVLPSMEAAFVDIGRGRNAVLYSGEVDWDAVETGNQPRRIELALKSGDRVLVQVTKDPVGHKGARLTSQISLPGRYLVYVPGGAMNGISRKLPDTERARLKKILKEAVPESSGVIVRTAAEGATEEQLTRDVQRLTSQWEHISAQVEKIQAPAMLHAEPDLLVKIVRDVFNEDFTKMLIQGEDAHHTISNYLESVAPDLLERVEKYEGDRDPFDEFRITEQIEKALDRKVWLPSGGSLVIDRTEAMTVIDVNTGKFVGSGGNLEETVTKNNLEAAEEIVRQLRLRDIGGIIVVDFIDMVLESNRDLVLRRLVECLSRDRTKHQVAEVTSLGLVQMTRKKIGLGLLETFSEGCEVCAGRGLIVHHDPVVKHRSGNGGGNGNGGGSNGGGRRGRGGQQNQQQNAQPAPATKTHTITEGAKSALAQIAASTMQRPDGTVETIVVDEMTAQQPVEPAQPERAERTERPKKRKKRQDGSAAPRTEKDELLDSVLNALPEPKAPGQGRGRRRVTTAALSGTPVLHLPANDDVDKS